MCKYKFQKKSLMHCHLTTQEIQSCQAISRFVTRFGTKGLGFTFVSMELDGALACRPYDAEMELANSLHASAYLREYNKKRNIGDINQKKHSQIETQTKNRNLIAL